MAVTFDYQTFHNFSLLYYEQRLNKSGGAWGNLFIKKLDLPWPNTNLKEFFLSSV